ncbi:hypothetical protein AJ80_04682 [Polytolypa hystricis UAMH7299]|uniref:Uncharacterized protein n=1 Tax=Polytolypa hystricis (strain UAMH7299) TaxID=1447883 RepID=A0A2B7Y9T9_POLH7|nr:hypothetical protein AJ80_04682 [Polytolypa hystricis UAMH7299]
MAPRRAHMNTIWFLLISSALALATPHISNAQSLEVLQRDTGSCADPSLQRCSDPNLPSDFCCPKSHTCISLDDSQTALCCPDGQNCTNILPITCNVQRQNATSDPGSLIKTTRLDDDLPKCGDSCCPHGYSCESGGGRCRQDSPSKTASAISSTSSAFSSSTTVSISTSTSTALSNVNQTDSALETTCPSFPPSALAVGFFSGLVTGALIILVVLFFRNRRRELRSSPPASRHSRQRSIDGKMVSISDPIPIITQDSSFRTDFLAHHNSLRRVHGNPNSRSRISLASARVKSFFGGGGGGDHHARGAADDAPPMPSMPITPPNQIYPRRQPSMESIKVYSPVHARHGQSGLAPPDDRIKPERPGTTFTEMMERVGFHNETGSPYYSITETPESHVRRKPLASPTGRR